jgi:hypothetical protein
MKSPPHHPVQESGQEEAHGYLRGYCRVCNRHFFFRQQLDMDHTQLHQHHCGVCQRCRYGCARIKSRPKIAVPCFPNGEPFASLTGVDLGKRGT